MVTSAAMGEGSTIPLIRLRGMVSKEIFYLFKEKRFVLSSPEDIFSLLSGREEGRERETLV